jgi:hypothetical protein
METITKHALPTARKEDFELIVGELQIAGNQRHQVSKLVRLGILKSDEEGPHQGLEIGNGHAEVSPLATYETELIGGILRNATTQCAVRRASCTR